MGDSVAFYDNTEIREGSFVCNSKNVNMDAREILSKLINSEHELRNFCKSHNIALQDGEHLFRYFWKYFDIKKNIMGSLRGTRGSGLSIRKEFDSIL